MDKAKFGKFINIVILGGLLGGFLSSWIAPRMIAWYFDPPVDIGVNCRSATEWSMAALQRSQMFGLLIGAGISIAIFVFIERRRANNPQSN